MTIRPLRIALTGATGYVGGRLLPRLEKEGHLVRCLARTPSHLQNVGKGTEVVKADLLDPDTLKSTLKGIEVAYYLVHSLGTGADFEEIEFRSASNFALAAKQAGVKRIIYLGGLGRSDAELSPHLRSRQRVGQALRNSGCQVIEFRASIIVGSGSLSFEMVRSLVETLPVMITPRWVNARAQPMSILDVLDYLCAALRLADGESQIYEIGGPETVTYGDLMHEYAKQRHLRRLLIPVPFLTPYLSSLWLGLVTPLYARVGRKLIDSIRHDTVVEDPRALNDFAIRPRNVSDAIRAALRNEDQQFALTRWSDSLSSGGGAPSWAGVRFGTRLVDSRTLFVPVGASAAFRPIQEIGGENGWYFGNWLWGIRGFLDLLFGGVGLRRGRKRDSDLQLGDVIDCWRVADLESPRRLRLSAEMKLPGRAWLEFEVTPGEGGCEIRQTAIFDPLGLRGLLYWYGIYPLHVAVFRGMLRGIGARARELSR